MLLHRKLLSYLILKNMKKLVYTIAIITLLVTFTSCTADEIENPKQKTTMQSQLDDSTQKVGDIIPPKDQPQNPIPPKP
jgi:hypothetical protein